MKKFILLSILVISVLAISIVSASWFDWFKGITGNVVDDSTNFPDTAKCTDSDNGVFANTAGVVINYGWSTKAYPDKCEGKAFTRRDSNGKAFAAYPQLREYYCDNGLKNQLMNSSNLVDGYCVKESVEVEGKKFVSAKWVVGQQVCRTVQNGVQDEAGKVYRNGCVGNVFRTYSCNGSVVQILNENCTTADGFGKCVPQGCTGRCSETDSENNKNVPGVVTFNNNSFKDECNSAKKAIRQYKCVNGIKMTVPAGEHGWASCGANRECILDNATGAGYCKDKYAGVATLESLQQQVNDLQESVSGMKAVVLQMLQSCTVNSQLTDDHNITGNSLCGDSGTCMGAFFSEVANPGDADFTLSNALRVTCSETYNGHTSSYYAQAICCSAE